MTCAIVPVSPRAAPPDEPFSLSPHSMVLKAHPLVPIALLILSALTWRGPGWQPAIAVALPFELEYAVREHVSIFGMGTLLALSLDNVSAFGGAIGVGVRFYFLGPALNGGFAGAMMSVGG